MSNSTINPQSRSIFGRLAENFIDLRGLPLGIKLLTIGGYLSVFFLLLMVLLFEIIGDDLPSIQFSFPGDPRNISLPLAVMAIAVLFFIVGWVYLLTGAGMAKARIFLSVLALFSFQLFMIVGVSQSVFPIAGEFIFFLAFLIVYALTYRTKFWRNFPLLHFGGWLGVILFFMILGVGTAMTDSMIAASLVTNFYVIMLITLIFWVFLGLDIMNLGITIGRSLTIIARRFLPFPALSALTVFILLVHPAIVLSALTLTKNWGWWFVDLILSVPLVLGASFVWLMHRWNTAAAATFLSLSFASPVAFLGVSMAFNGSDVVELLLALTGIFPPLLLFVSLTTYNLMGTGVTFTGVDGRVMPRGARILLYFGTVILVVTFMLLISRERVVETKELALDVQGLINDLFALSGLFLGIPYVIWLVWKRREKVIGDEKAFTSPPRWTWLERIPAWVLLTLSLITACLLSCSFVAVLYLFR